MNPIITDARKNFGDFVRSLRRRTRETQLSLGQRLGMSHSNIAAIENGRRAVGNQVAERLAEALRTDADTKPKFMLMAAATRIKDRLLELASKAHPLLIHYVVANLFARGMGPDSIQYVVSRELTYKGSHESFGEIPQIKVQLEKDMQAYFLGICGIMKSPLPFLVLTLKDGTKAYCGLVVAKA